MSTIFSRQCEYALQATMYLALKPPGEMTTIKELTTQLPIPYHFLGKILQDLAHKGLVRSLKGPAGGFALAASPEELTPFMIIEAIDGTEFTHSCIMGFDHCDKDHPCSLHEPWSVCRDIFQKSLTTKSIREMAEEMHKPEYLHEQGAEFPLKSEETKGEYV